ncbi:hypothetical protein AMECASPLE_028876 [Ameca splendens]|uniref:Uncharacterized protein n=1 Tax=Ameca splendens TaxID=208324 RepID=A0ABV0Y5H4_9TELE
MRTTVRRRSETAENSCPESACFCWPKREADAAESAELEYPIANFILTSPRFRHKSARKTLNLLSVVHQQETLLKQQETDQKKKSRCQSDMKAALLS